MFETNGQMEEAPETIPQTSAFQGFRTEAPDSDGNSCLQSTFLNKWFHMEYGISSSHFLLSVFQTIPSSYENATTAEENPTVNQGNLFIFRLICSTMAS